MNPQLENSIDRISTGARGSVRALINGARARGHRAADRVQGGKQPLNAISGLGLKLSAVSHRTADRVLKQNTTLAAHQLDAIAERLDSAATASCMRDLVGKQFRMTPGQIAHFGNDAKGALSIVVEGGLDARDVIRASLGNLRQSATTVKAPARRKTASKKKAASKTTAAKTAGRKQASKKKAKTTPAKKSN